MASSGELDYVPPVLNYEDSPTPITELTPELAESLRKRSHTVLSYLVATNSKSIFFNEYEPLAAFRDALDGQVPDDVDDLFSKTVELSEYNDYLPFVDRFFQKDVKVADVENLMAPGLPYFIAHSSGTSGGKTKHFPKYQHPKHMSTSTAQTMAASNPTSKTGGKNCVVYSLGYMDVVKPLDENGEVAKHITVCLMSSGTIRMHTGMDQPRDAFYQKMKVPVNTAPLGASFIPNYKSFMFIHGLFALAERNTELINTMFSTLFRDFYTALIERFDEVVDCIEKGTLPDMDGIAHVKDNLMQYWSANPERAQELRTIGNDTTQPGWLKRVFPKLAIVVAISSGPFSSVLPEMKHHMGPDVQLRTLGINCSEAFLALAYDSKDPSLYKVVGTDEIIEYLDIDLPENAKGLLSAWEVQVGKKYEVILTTRDGFWRYRLGDVVEVVGFDPRDGQPIIHYLERRSSCIRLASEITTESELTGAIMTVSKDLGTVAEFCVMGDYRATRARYGYWVETQNNLPDDASHVPERVHAALKAANSNYDYENRTGKLGVPTVHILKKGTFAEFRDWKIRSLGISSGQVKVPLVVWEEATRKFLEERELREVVGPASVDS
ncbi:hypothetical protein CONPUDRAFT_82204 [Coniophora puteana RWD-64-598 SS2]|uniref:Uncharacterized protein n=1 Tax=Coniophora puteana (strain RWD-64-598) TaxID=741705 RepID=A0A5M3MPS0_CONPW|nr:uncharacterized protein CONPUDRAFT_82204 [Coniophora puteana RWD-64-598 SS2]EIW81168.1 hypothetical protein CONPUDRAFT_82204 [Coniophora puteana RWD-64-598 SS2]